MVLDREYCPLTGKECDITAQYPREDGLWCAWGRDGYCHIVEFFDRVCRLSDCVGYDLPEPLNIRIEGGID